MSAVSVLASDRLVAEETEFKFLRAIGSSMGLTRSRELNSGAVSLNIRRVWAGRPLPLG